jgi:diadenosine tetraphosphatase ApaH/serine/threonine PP2A family protein phosphatase
MNRTIYIGDVHGCIDELKELIHKLEIRETDKIIFLGDLIHKGLHSTEVLEYVTDLQHNNSNVFLICGNHEEKHMRWLLREEAIAGTSLVNTIQHAEEFPSVHVSSASRALIENSLIAKRDGNFVAVHAGITPAIEELEFLSLQELRAAGGKRRSKLEQLLRIRYQNTQGKLVGEDQQNDGDYFWAEKYNGRLGTVIFGHHPFMDDQPKKFNHAYGIDLGCVFGGYLCALIVENETIQYLVVKAQQIYKPKPNLR